MSEIPSVVYEGTNIEIVRKEGSTLSAKVVNPVFAGDILSAMLNSSGLTQAINGSGTLANVAGVALFQGTSGQRVTCIKGKVRATWDGSGSPVFGSPIDVSTGRSGWWEPAATGANSSGVSTQIGWFFGTGAGSSLGASNSGTLQIVEIQ